MSIIENIVVLNDDDVAVAALAHGRQPALTGCPWHDVNEMLQTAGLRPTRQRMALGWLLFGKGARHLTAEMLYEEATQAKVPVSLATVYNTLKLFVDKKLVREVIVDPSKVFYDPNTEPHHHFYNVDSGELTDIDARDVMVTGLPALPKGMATEGVDIIVRVRSEAP